MRDGFLSNRTAHARSTKSISIYVYCHIAQKHEHEILDDASRRIDAIFEYYSHVGLTIYSSTYMFVVYAHRSNLGMHHESVCGDTDMFDMCDPQTTNNSTKNHT